MKTKDIVFVAISFSATLTRVLTYIGVPFESILHGFFLEFMGWKKIMLLELCSFIITSFFRVSLFLWVAQMGVFPFFVFVSCYFSIAFLIITKVNSLVKGRIPF